MPIIDKNMEDYPWDKQESNISAEEWDTQQKWVQGFSHVKWLNCEYTDSMYIKVNGYKGPGPNKWNYDVADSSE